MSGEAMEIDETATPAHEVPEWAHPIFLFLKDEILPSNEVLARQTVRREKAYTIINNDLYKRSITSILQRCVDSAEGQEILLDRHQGECGHHALSRALVAKAFRHGFYWSTTLKEAKELV